MVSVPRMVHELPLGDHCTQQYGNRFIVISLFQHELEPPLHLLPLTRWQVHAKHARPGRATRCALQVRHKRDVVGHAPTQPRPWKTQCGQGLVEFALFRTFMMVVLAAGLPHPPGAQRTGSLTAAKRI